MCVPLHPHLWKRTRKDRRKVTLSLTSAKCLWQCATSQNRERKEIKETPNGLLTPSQPWLHFVLPEPPSSVADPTFSARVQGNLQTRQTSPTSSFMSCVTLLLSSGLGIILSVPRVALRSSLFALFVLFCCALCIVCCGKPSSIPTG